jgi:hypothetical protein
MEGCCCVFVVDLGLVRQRPQLMQQQVRNGLTSHVDSSAGSRQQPTTLHLRREHQQQQWTGKNNGVKSATVDADAQEGLVSLRREVRT